MDVRIYEQIMNHLINNALKFSNRGDTIYTQCCFIQAGDFSRDLNKDTTFDQIFERQAKREALKRPSEYNYLVTKITDRGAGMEGISRTHWNVRLWLHVQKLVRSLFCLSLCSHIISPSWPGSALHLLDDHLSKRGNASCLNALRWHCVTCDSRAFPRSRACCSGNGRENCRQGPVRRVFFAGLEQPAALQDGRRQRVHALWMQRTCCPWGPSETS